MSRQPWNNTLGTSRKVSQIKRQAVIRTAARIFSRQGYHNSSLTDLAADLHVSKATLYNYVRDKQEILFECHKLALAIGDKALLVAKQNNDRPSMILRAVFYQYITSLFDAFGVSGVLTEIGALRPEDRQAITQRRDSFEKEIIAIVEAGIALGEFRDVDANLTVKTMMGCINALSTWYDPNGRLSNIEIADSTISLFERGIGA